MLEICNELNRLRTGLLFGAAALLIAGCDSSTPETDEKAQLAGKESSRIGGPQDIEQTQPKGEATARQSVTLFLPGMNQELEIL